MRIVKLSAKKNICIVLNSNVFTEAFCGDNYSTNVMGATTNATTNDSTTDSHPPLDLAACCVICPPPLVALFAALVIVVNSIIGWRGLWHHRVHPHCIGSVGQGKIPPIIVLILRTNNDALRPPPPPLVASCMGQTAAIPQALTNE
jgi:hypothetical protein